jgi:glycosyltransferase involved in cell wall biosynthesis
MMESSRLLSRNIKIMGNMPKAQYAAYLAGAKFLFHPGLHDNGNMTAFDAAYLGVPTICADYEVMRYFEEYLHLGMRFFNPHDDEDIAEALLDAERRATELRQSLPTRAELSKFTVENEEISVEIYKVIRDNLLPGGEL